MARVKYVRFATDRGHVRARALSLSISVAVFLLGLAYVRSGHPVSTLRDHRGVGRAAFAALVAGPALAIHAGVGLLTDAGLLPRVLIKRVQGGVKVTSLARALLGPWRHLATDSPVTVSAAAKLRPGLPSPGYRVTLTLGGDGEPVEAVVVTSTPELAAGWMVAGLERAGVSAVVGEPRVNAAGQTVVSE